MDGSVSVRTPVSGPAHATRTPSVSGVGMPSIAAPSGFDIPRVESVRTNGVERVRGVELLQSMNADMYGPWFGALQEVVLGLVRELGEVKTEAFQLRSMLGLQVDENGMDPLSKLNYERTANQQAVPLSKQIIDLQRLVMRSITGNRSLALFGLLKDEGKTLRATYIKKWMKFARRRGLALVLLGDCKAVMRSKYFKKLVEFRKISRKRRRQERAVSLLLRSTTHGLMMVYYHNWKKMLKKKLSRYPVARRLAILNGKVFVHRYWEVLAGYPAVMKKKRNRWNNLLWVGRMATRRVALRYFKKLLWYQAKKPVFMEVAPVVLGTKNDKRAAIAHALAMNNNNLARRVYYRKWVKYRWMLKRGGVASRLAVLKEREMLGKYVERLRKFGSIMKIAKMEKRVDASLTGLTNTNEIIDKLVDRLVSVEAVVDTLRVTPTLAPAPAEYQSSEATYHLRNCSPPRPRASSPMSLLPQTLRGVRSSKMPPGPPPTMAGPIPYPSPPRGGLGFGGGDTVSQMNVGSRMNPLPRGSPRASYVPPPPVHLQRAQQPPPPQPYHYSWN